MESLGTVEKALDVLFHLHREGGSRGVTQIGRALGIPKSSTHRLLASLGRRGLVERDAEGRYRPGIALVALGIGVLASEPVVGGARPVLEEEAEALGETFFLVGARAGRLVVLDKAEGNGFVRAAPRIGAVVPVHATAAGKLFLAFAPELVASPAEPFERFTPRTPEDSAALDREVRAARRRGFATNVDEWIAGLSVAAAPVRAGERVLGVVALAAASERFRELGPDALAERVVGAAGRIAARLSGRAG